MRLRYANLTEKKRTTVLRKKKRAIKLSRWTNGVAVKHKNVEKYVEEKVSKKLSKRLGPGWLRYQNLVPSAVGTVFRPVVDDE